MSEKHLALCSQSFVMFALGSRVVERVGLFDERFHPAYWEDIDYNWRCHEAGIDVVHTGIEIDHVGCATRNSLMDHRDEKFRDVFARNRTLHLHKQEIGELGDGHWSLSRRRQQTWD